MGADEKEIYFTGSGSEADNWAIKGVAHSAKGRHIITTAIEHHAVLHSFEYLGRNGFEVTYLKVDNDGLVNPDDLRAAVREDTSLISIMTANNEIGTIQPIKELAQIAKEHKIPFHTDAVQAFGHIPLNVEDLGLTFYRYRHTRSRPKG